MGTVITDLPSNMLVEILLRLPIKTLVSCTCLSKAFCSLIRSHLNPYAYNNNNNSSKGGPAAQQYLVMQFDNIGEPSRCLRFLDTESPDAFSCSIFKAKPIVRITKGLSNKKYCNDYGLLNGWDFVYKNPFFLVNSCNGLIFVVDGFQRSQRSMVCNPITRECMLVPEPEEDTGDGPFTESLWLGFSPDTGQYKVVRIFSYLDEYDWRTTIGAQVHVVGSNSSCSWRDIRIPDGPLRARLDWKAPSASVDGVIYWLSRSKRYKEKFIISFDFVTESFKEIEPPRHHHLREDRSCMSIGVLNGCLCFTKSTQKFLHVWARKKNDGDGGFSWRKEFMAKKVIAMDKPLDGSLRPLMQVVGSGEIIMMWKDSTLVSYDPRDKTFRCPWPHRESLRDRAVAFAPSIVPLRDILMVRNKNMQKEGPSFCDLPIVKRVRIR